VRISISDTSVYANIQDNDADRRQHASLPFLQSTNTLVLKDGQSREFTAATDRAG
jgi:hypothetical protein